MSHRNALPARCALTVLALLSSPIGSSAQSFRITSVQVTNSDLRITWNAPGGSSYVVQSVTSLESNFSDLGPTNLVPGIGSQTLSYTHSNRILNGTSRFYRVRSFPASSMLQSLLVYPANATIGLGMTNRYKAFAVYSDNSTNDVTANATFTSLNTNVAELAQVANDFAFVRGTSGGIASIRVIYQEVTNANTVSLTVAQLIGLYTVPPLSQIHDYVEGQSTSVKVMGVFANGQTNNVTPASTLESSFSVAPEGTRVNYNVSADVANSFALITGQSAAAEILRFSLGGMRTSDFAVNWCWFTNVALQPQYAQITVGQTQEFSVFGQMANGTTTNPLLLTYLNSGSLTSTGTVAGTNVVSVNVNNGPGDFCSSGLNAYATVSVSCPYADTVDLSFDPGAGANGTVLSLAVQADSKVIIGGDFSMVNGTNRNRIARLDVHGNLDASFDPGMGANNGVRTMALQTDGKVLIGGSFTIVNGTNRTIARLNSNGSLDASFNSDTGFGNVESVVVQTNGRVLIGGSFTSVNGMNRNRIARLNSDGSLDTSFNPGTGANGTVYSVALQKDGKVLMGGIFFFTVNGTDRLGVARLNANGSLDTSFNPGTGPNFAVLAVAVQPDDKVLIGGYFTSVNGVSRSRVARLNANGSLDTTFNPGTGADSEVASIAVQADGRILLGGRFSYYNGVVRNALARLEADGRLDPSFARCGCAGVITKIFQDACRGAYVGGDFSLLHGVPRRNIGRLLTGSSVLPPNDDFGGRSLLSGAPVSTTAANHCATKETGEPEHASNVGGKSLWWSWTAPANGLVTISTCGSDFDTLLGVYTGSSVSALTLVTNNNDSAACGAGSPQSRVQFTAVSGTNYQIAVDGFKYPAEPGSRSGNVMLTVQQ